MKHIAPLAVILSSLVSVQSAHADETFLAASLNLLKQSLPDTTTVTFNKSRFKFNGCKHRQYELLVNQPVTENMWVEFEIEQAKGQLEWGTYSQSVQVNSISFTPRYGVTDNLSVGFGFEKQASPVFKTTQGFDIDLPKSQKYVLSTRFTHPDNRHQVELALSSTKWQATSVTGNWFDRGKADNKLMLEYTGSF